jgi:L-lactate dehydrogenase complex protein LldF
MKGAAATFRTGRRLGLAERLTPLGLRAARALGVARRWTSARDLPPPAPESFRAWWQRTDGGRHD